MGTIADWLVAVGTMVLAVVAIFQDSIRGWFYLPKFRVSIKTESPDCGMIAMTTADGRFIANTVHLRLWVENVGNVTAKNAEVFASELRRKRTEGKWERVTTFMP